MFKAFIRQKFNPNIEPGMPPDYPWQVYLVEDKELIVLENGWEIVTSEEYELIIEEYRSVITAWMVEKKPPLQEPNFAQESFDKYMRRSQNLFKIIAMICAENEARLRSGKWTLSKLMEITESPQFSSVLNSIMSLSFELAVGKITNLPDYFIEKNIKDRYLEIIKGYM